MAMYHLIYEGATAMEAMAELLGRAPKHELA